MSQHRSGSIKIIGKRICSQSGLLFYLKRGDQDEAQVGWESVDSFQGDVQLLRHLAQDFERKCTLLKFSNNNMKNQENPSRCWGN